jgi:hypothetical protein
MRALQAAEKRIRGCKKRQGTTSPAAEKLLRAVGWGFIPGTTPSTSIEKSIHAAEPRSTPVTPLQMLGAPSIAFF